MEYLFPILLTILSFCFIIIVLKKIEKKFLKPITYKQSDIYKVIKTINSINQPKVEKKSQLDKMLEENVVNVIVLDNKAYWVLNNVFYTADYVDGTVDGETTQPIDTSDMSKDDIDKMLFILDKLGDGKNYDSGGSRS